MPSVRFPLLTLAFLCLLAVAVPVRLQRILSVNFGRRKSLTRLVSYVLRGLHSADIPQKSGIVLGAELFFSGHLILQEKTGSRLS